MMRARVLHYDSAFLIYTHPRHTWHGSHLANHAETLLLLDQLLLHYPVSLATHPVKSLPEVSLQLLEFLKRTPLASREDVASASENPPTARQDILFSRPPSKQITLLMAGPDIPANGMVPNDQGGAIYLDQRSRLRASGAELASYRR